MAEKTDSRRVVFLIVGVAFLAGLLLCLLWVGVRRLFVSPMPPQPVSGYTGDWKMHGTHGEEERLLPSAAEIWRYHENWQPTNIWTSKFYIARIGHSERQLNFQSFTNKGGSLGDFTTTRVQFLYHDPTNGDYAISWSLRGKHDVSFLKFDEKERWVQLQLLGGPGTQPPQLEILGMEGFAPFYNFK